MERRRLSAVLTALILALSLIMCSCGSSKSSENEEAGETVMTLETYLAENPYIQSYIDESMSDSGEKEISCVIKDNDVIYNYDLVNMEDMTEDTAQEDWVKESLDKNMAGQEGSFIHGATYLEYLTGIEEIREIVRYSYGDEIIAEYVYESDPEMLEEIRTKEAGKAEGGEEAAPEDKADDADGAGEDAGTEDQAA
ncbi:MAG: hypothetical protein IJ227_01100 [Mogibacterium sp.]|nr:hypothetical protein [Mogibacterium sp.]